MAVVAARSVLARDPAIVAHARRVRGVSTGDTLRTPRVGHGLPDSRAATWTVVRIPPWKHVVVLEALVVAIGALTVWDGLAVLAGW
ncbi:hypothetical protein [Elioraea sp.]|uniref:hypothetical protein n=1 Tax=Elioraea sp. TaxID=2185103 RepID=UPI003F6E7D72